METVRDRAGREVGAAVEHAAVDRAIAAFHRGEPTVVADDVGARPSAVLALPAQRTGGSELSFLVRHTTGLVRVALPCERLVELGLDRRRSTSPRSRATASAISVDHLPSTTTGVSACDRAATVRALASGAERGQFVQPGHVLVSGTARWGVLERPAGSEAAVDLARASGAVSAAALAELSGPDGAVLGAADGMAFARERGLAHVTVAEIVRYRRSSETLVEPTWVEPLPTRLGHFTVHAYRYLPDGREHLALVRGEPSGATEPVLTRVHSECLTGDVLHSSRCDCGSQLDAALAAIAARGCGVVAYLRGHEGRGIGLIDKLRAYRLQDEGLDTVDANLALGLPVDARDYGPAAQVLTWLGVRRVALLTSNPDKAAGLARDGIEVARRIPLPGRQTPANTRYLMAKRDRLGHGVDSGRLAAAGDRDNGGDG